MSGRTAVLLGATGLTGAACLRALLREARYGKVIAVVRRPLREQDEKLEARITDFRDWSGVGLPDGADLFFAIGTTIRKAGSQAEFRRVDVEIPMAVSRLSNGRRLVLVSSVGADSKSGNFYLRTKGELEDALNSPPFEAVQILRPSLLLGDRGEKRFSERLATVVSKVISPALVGGLRKYHAIEAEVVGRAMVGAALSGAPGKHVYHYDEIRSFANRP